MDLFRGASFTPTITSQPAPVLHAPGASTRGFAKNKSSTPRSHKSAKRGRGRPKSSKAPVRDYKNLIHLLPSPGLMTAPRAHLPAGMEADSNDQSLDWPTTCSTSRWRRPRRMIDNTTINHETELITDTPFFLTAGGNWTSLGNILVSRRYYASYIYETFLNALGYREINTLPQHVEPSINPRGGIFKPIGKAPLCVYFANGTTPLLEFYVLPGEPEAGIPFILGGADIGIALGGNWTPQQNVAS